MIIAFPPNLHHPSLAFSSAFSPPAHPPPPNSIPPFISHLPFPCPFLSFSSVSLVASCSPLLSPPFHAYMHVSTYMYLCTHFYHHICLSIHISSTPLSHSHTCCSLHPHTPTGNTQQSACRKWTTHLSPTIFACSSSRPAWILRATQTWHIEQL